MITRYFHTSNATEFNWMPVRDAISWTIMISGHVQNELFTKAVENFQNMRVVGVESVSLIEFLTRIQHVGDVLI